MQIKVLKNEGNLLIFTLDKINPVIANTLRRSALNHVPTLAIDELTIQQNDSALYDEMLAHRIGLIPFVTDLKSYVLPEACKCKGKGCSRCQLSVSLKAKGPCVVYSGMIKSDDPKAVPAHEKMPIVKLEKEQSLTLEGVATLGIGKTHAKYIPGLVTYRGYPELQVSKESNLKEALQHIPPAVLTAKGNDLEIKDVTQWKESYEDILEQHGVQVTASAEKFVFTIESWGQLDPQEILTQAVQSFESTLEAFETFANKLD